MNPDWSPLTTELSIWRAQHRRLPLWWRDDDATAPTEPLDQLMHLAEMLELPVHLAVIPQPATPALADVIRNSPQVTALVHGWAHVNHAPEGQKKAEFAGPRTDATAEAQAGLTRLRGLFGPDLFEMFVPPWNRVAPALTARLPDMGYRALSTYTPRQTREAAPGLTQINTHMDPIHWRGGGGLVDADTQITALVRHLQDRRAGRADTDEPLGFLTHHLVHDDAIWEFTHACLSTLLAGGATPVNLNSLKGPLP